MTIAETLTQYLNQRLDSTKPENLIIEKADLAIMEEMKKLESRIDIVKFRRAIGDQIIATLNPVEKLANLTNPPGYIMISMNLTITLVLCSLMRGVNAAALNVDTSQEIGFLNKLYEKE